MHYFIRIFILLTSLLSINCSTLNESLKLGAATGSFAGATTAYSAYSSVGPTPSFDRVAAGAGIGLGIGLLTSYLIHGKVEENRQNTSPVPEIYFGDLPPSPFIFPKANSKKGGI